MNNLQALLSKVPWIPVGIGAGVLLLLGIIALLFLRRRARRAGPARAISAGALVRVWTRFLAQIPGEFRRYVLHFQSFVVLGEAGSGKSLLIGKCTDWKGQAAQFYPSYTADPMLQLYLGTRTLVQEVPSALLTDTSSTARTALVRLWRRTAKKRAPVAVVTVSAAALRDASPDALRLSAQMVRGKLNVLSRVVNAPIDTRVVVTHMDQVEGYLAFAEFVEKQEIPHRITIDQSAPGLGLATCLEPFEEYLPLALTKLPARDHLRVLNFLARGPATFERLGLFLSTLRESDPRSFEPELRDLFLSSHSGGGPSAISNPFETSWSMHGQAIERAVRNRHRLFAAALLLLGLTWLGLGFAREHRRLTEARVALENFEREADLRLGGETEKALEKFAEGGSDGWGRLLPSFTQGAPEQMRARLARAIREKHLVPMARTLRASERPHEQGLYLLGLVYADREGPMGKLILRDKNVEEWAAALGLPDAAVRAYVNASDAPWTGTLSLDELPYERVSSPVTQPETWHSLFIELRNALATRAITADRLRRLQENARRLRDALVAARRRHITKEIHELLGGDPRFQRALFERYTGDLELPPWLVQQGKQFDALLNQLIEARMDLDARRIGNLDELVSRLRGFQQLAKALHADTLQIKVEDKVYTFDGARWQLVINNGKALTCVQEFVREHQRSGTQMFFRDRGGYPTIGMAQNDLFFPGRGTVAGELTRAAYVGEVVPQLQRYEDTLRELDLEREARDPLENLVSGAVAEYASEYERAWRGYYDAWALGAENLGSLTIILGKMKLPASRFEEFLQTVAENTTLPEPTSFHQRAIYERATEFEPIARLLGGDAASVSTGTRARTSRLDGYRSILADALHQLDTAPPAAAEPKADEKAKEEELDFEALTTPLGRLCFDIAREDRDSYLRLTQDWLDKAGIAEQWRGPFLQPIQAIDRLGREDLARSIQRSWSDRVRAQVTPLLDKFPFNPKQLASANQIDFEGALLRSTGRFWVGFRRFIAPACAPVPGQPNRWQPLPALATGFKWPQELFGVVNHLAGISDALWDSSGVPRPLVITLRAEPLPVPAQPGEGAVLAFMSSGQSSVFGFNQRPTWQNLEVAWWTRAPAQVGLQLGTAEEGQRENFSVTVPEGHWALHRLLRTRPVERDGVSFAITTNRAAQPVINVRFSFQEDPFLMFEIPGLPKEGSDEIK